MSYYGLGELSSSLYNNALSNAGINGSVSGMLGNAGSSLNFGSIAPLSSSYFSGALNDTAKNAVSGFDWGSAFGDLSKHYTKHKDLYGGIGSIATGIGGAWNDYNTSREAKSMNDFYKSQYRREQGRQESNDNAFSSGFSNSSYGA